jgi:hypothetical protein
MHGCGPQWCKTGHRWICFVSFEPFKETSSRNKQTPLSGFCLFERTFLSWVTLGKTVTWATLVITTNLINATLCLLPARVICAEIIVAHHCGDWSMINLLIPPVAQSPACLISSGMHLELAAYKILAPPVLILSEEASVSARHHGCTLLFGRGTYAACWIASELLLLHYRLSRFPSSLQTLNLGTRTSEHRAEE